MSLPTQVGAVRCFTDPVRAEPAQVPSFPRMIRTPPILASLVNTPAIVDVFGEPAAQHPVGSSQGTPAANEESYKWLAEDPAKAKVTVGCKLLSSMPSAMRSALVCH